MRNAIQVLGVCFGALFLCSPLYSQANSRLLGTITDQTGGVISGATVTVLDTARGVSRTLITDDAGAYNAPNLAPGPYTVRAEAKGFRNIERQNIVLEVDKEIRVDLTLLPGEQSQTITVTETIPLVETSNATLGGTLSNQTINDLPLNGRNYINLLTLRPGMNIYPGGGGSTRSANGTRTEDIGYLVEGLREDDPYTGSSVLNAAIAAGDSSTSLPIDAIQEFNTEQNVKAEYGWKPGAIVNAGLKSGTNTIHGTAFMFGRTTALDARNYFNVDASGNPTCATNPTPCLKAPIGLKQYGASFGAPIKKDHLFYFVNYEGQRYSAGSTFYTTPPFTVTAPGGPNPKFSLLDACNAVASKPGGGFNGVGTAGGVTPLSAQIAGITIDPVAGCKIAPPNYTPGTSESLFPTNTGSDRNGVILGLVSTNTQNNGVAKVDYHINDHHSLSGMYFNGQGGGYWNDAQWQVALPGSSGGPFLSSLFGYIQVGSGAWTWTPNSTVVNEFRAGYIHFRQYYDSIDRNVNPLAYGINTGVTDPRFFGFPLIRIDPFAFGTFRLGGNWPKHTGPDGALQFLEHVSVLRGKHAFKFGGEIIHNTAEPFITSNGRGRIRFSNLSNFLKGSVRGGGNIILAGDPARHYHDSQYAVFLQDDWRVKPRLTLNLGLRYELTTVLADRDNKLGNFDPVRGLVQVGIGEASAFNGDHKAFSPRLGFAWDVKGDGKTVIRGGGSIMYEQLPFSLFTAVANALGLNQVPTGASTVACSANPCTNGSTQIITPGSGNMGVLSENPPGKSLSPGWQNQSNGACIDTTKPCTIFPASIFALQCGDGLSFTDAGGTVRNDPAPCNSEAVNPNLRLPYVSAWNLGIQRAITNNLSVEVSYVGNHGTKFLGFANINQPPLGAGYCMNSPLTAGQIAAGCTGPTTTLNAAAETAAQPFFTKFPNLAQIDQLSNIDHSNYNGLHVTVTQRPSRGLSFLVGYTYSHALDNTSANFGANFLPVDSSHPAGLYGNSDFDVRHRLTLTTTYMIPGIKSPGQVFQGWQLNSVVTLQSGAPWTARDASNDFSGTNQVNELASFGQLWNFYGNPDDFKAGRGVPIDCFGACDLTGRPVPAVCAGHPNTDLSFGCYVRGTSALVAPAAGTLGTAGRNIFRDLGYRNWDVSVIKDYRIKERLTTQFRAEFFNVLNHPIFYNPNGPAGAGANDPSASSSFGCSCNTPDQASPNPVLGTGASRSIQLGLKVIW
jgi:outer membrane receptor protein involved in Fe transport